MKSGGVCSMKNKTLIILLVILLTLPNLGMAHSQEELKILFDEYHAEVDTDIEIPDFLQELRKKGYTVDFSKKQITSVLLSEYNVFVIFNQVESFSEDEVEAVVSFVKNGGGLIIVGENGGYIRGRGILETVNEVPTIFGIKFNMNYVADRKTNAGDICWPVISTFADHPVTKGVKRVVYGCGCSLELESSATALAFGNSTTTAGEKTGEDVVILAAAEYGKGKVLVIGDSNLFAGPNTESWITGDKDFLYLMDNKKLALNMFEWTAQPVSEAPTSPVSTTEADDLATRGYSLFSQGKYSQARLKFERALRIYSEAKESQKVSDMRKMIDKCDKGLDAETAYQKGTDYYEEGEYNIALTEFEKSKSLYNELGDSDGSSKAQEMIEACNNALKRLDAEAAYTAGEEYFNDETYESALTEFEKSKSLYDELGDSDGSSKAQEMIDICSKTLNAEATYGRGMEYYNEKEYKMAISTFEEAIPLYEELGNDAKINELKTRKKEAQDVLDKRAKRNRMLGIIVIFVLVVAAFLFVYVFLRRPEPQEPLDILQSETVYCKSCGKKNVKGALYCKYCKTALKPLDELEKEKIKEDLRKRREKGDITEEEYQNLMKELEESL
jgi:tetratricopeptide (TPR) repeat protein